jgi:3-methylfumaryl-CoA hydratase
LLFRYSAVTFNSHRIHYDQPYATGVEGYRGLVVHGPLIATLLLDLAAREFGPNTLKKFTMRAQSPAFCGELLHLVCKNEGQNITLAAIGNDDRAVMSTMASN